jgi:hypothetical protein
MRYLVVFLFSIFLFGCAGTETASDSGTANQPHTAWMGKNISEMIEAWGEPSWSREYESDENPGVARWYERRRSAGVSGRHTGQCWTDAAYDGEGIIVRTASSSSPYCGPSR